ncbi:CLUMA_CG004879, isoform A [Clunio marinus]|uniref:CLUMA_CG004879, isoform A n=1 Tax=Clunio marinus TaxID=568069 RepID=A0A1J1HV13_9DIPT|nr:CLUMA_CG004879, isoform A [Clunio marinus]
MIENIMEKSINVYLRIRPNTTENENIFDENNSQNTSKMVVINSNPYIFDHIFYPVATQDDFKVMVEPLVTKLLAGFNCSLLAYGQSGTGKTYTMGLYESSDGLIAQTVNSMMSQLENDPSDVKNIVKISYIEIYNEKVYDLLVENCFDPIYAKGTIFQGSTQIPIKDFNEAYEIIQKGNKIRHVRDTKLNSSSSRSHAMLSVFLTRSNENSAETSVMRFCDLAGCEGIRNTHHIGMAQKEGVNINSGLLAVGKVVKALIEDKKLIPYRDSVLTMVLKDSLNTKSYISILGCISSSIKDRTETLSTIQFVQRIKTLDSKNIPEYNAYMKEKQRLQARTPLKSYMLPLSTNKRVNSVVKTPRAKSDYNYTGTIRKTLTKPQIGQYSFKPNSRKSLRFNKSNLNDTFNVVDHNESSCSSMNRENHRIECQNQHNFQFSPLMRRIEMAIDNKFSSFMETIKNQTIQNSLFYPELLRSSVRSSVASSVAKTINCNKDPLDDSSYSEITNFTISNDDASSPTTSTVLRRQGTNENNNFMMNKRSNDELMAIAISDSENEITLEVPSNETVISRPPIRRSTRIQIRKQEERLRSISNETIPEETSHRITKRSLEKNILQILNNGSLKELQKIPAVGLKTAQQILTYRSVNGKFKTLAAVKKVHGMRGKFYENFLMANTLK